MTSVSIVIPCRNGADFLGATIRSALNQTAPPDEILVIDDGSTDDSAAIAEGLGARVIAGEAAGAPAARILGAARARGARLLFLDADDLLTPGTLAALGRRLDAGPEAAVAICPWDRLELDGAAWVVGPPTAELPRPGRDMLAAWLEGSWSPPCAILWTRAGYELSGGWDTRLQVDQDGALMRRALARGVVPLRCEDGLALYRRLPGGRVSLSGRRHEEAGLASRLAGLAETRDELDRAGRLPRYRSALATAFLDLARDAPPGSETGGAAQAAARDLRRGARARTGSDLGARLAARIGEWRRPAAAPAPLRPAGGEGAAPLTQGPLVSVIVPTFDRRESVIRAAQSVLAQDYRTTEVLVVDDGSSDGTAERLEGLGDPRLRVIRQQNGGVARARNRGLAEARGPYIAFLDDDDSWHPEKLSHQVAALEAAPARVGFCHTAIELWRGDTLVETRPALAQGDVFTSLLLSNPVHAPTTTGLVRREVVEAVGGFDPALPAIEDWDWLQRVSRLYHLLALDRPLARYDMSEDPDTPRRSQRFRANMAAREMLWSRNAHALRRAGLAHLYLLESARRELREPEGLARLGRRLVLRALAERPQHRAHWPWLGYMAAPFALRRGLRHLDAPRYRRRLDAKEIGG